MCVELWHANAEIREHRHQTRRRRRLGLDLPHDAIERLVALIGAILDLELEASDGTETIDRRRRKDCDYGVGNAGKFGLQFLRNRKARQIAGGALLERLQRDE